MVYTWVEVMDLQGELALEYVQSYQRECAVVVAAVFADVYAFHKAQIDLEDIAAGLTGSQAGASAHPLHKSHTDVPVKVGNHRGVILGRVRTSRRRITRQENVVNGCPRAERLDAAGDRLGAASVGRSAASEGEGRTDLR